MHYLHAAIIEATRLYPPVTFNGRVGNYSAYTRMEKLVPEHWLGNGGEFAAGDAAHYPVFHARPTCR